MKAWSFCCRLSCMVIPSIDSSSSGDRYVSGRLGGFQFGVVSCDGGALALDRSLQPDRFDLALLCVVGQPSFPLLVADVELGRAVPELGEVFDDPAAAGE